MAAVLPFSGGLLTGKAACSARSHARPSTVLLPGRSRAAPTVAANAGLCCGTRPSISGVRPKQGSLLGRPARGALARTQAAAGEQQVQECVIIGGGLSGLVTGQVLASKHGIRDFLVTEARERVGGNITSMEGGGYIWEEGPNSFTPNDSMLQIAVSAADYGSAVRQDIEQLMTAGSLPKCPPGSQTGGFRV